MFPGRQGIAVKVLRNAIVPALGASLLAWANASLVGILSAARVSFLACRSLAGSSNAGTWVPSRKFLAIQS